MHKSIEKGLANYNLTFQKDCGYGYVDGYEFNVWSSPSIKGLVLSFSTYLSQSKKNDFVLKVNKLKMQFVLAGSFDYGVLVTVNAWTNKNFEKKLPNVIAEVLKVLAELEAPKATVCPQSGEVLDEFDCKLTTVQDTKIRVRLSNNAIDTVNSSIDQANEDFQKAPNNYLKGFLGIAIGAVVGVIIAFVCSMLGYVTSIAPLASIFLGVFLYKKFGGKPNFVMIVMSLVTTVVAILGTLVLLYSIIAAEAVAEAGLTMGSFEALTFCLEEVDEFKSAFVEEIAMNGLFILIAAGLSVADLLKMIRRPKNIG